MYIDWTNSHNHVYSKPTTRTPKTKYTHPIRNSKDPCIPSPSQTYTRICYMCLEPPHSQSQTQTRNATEKSSNICNQKIPQYQQCHANGEEQQDMSPEDTTIPAVSHKWRRAARYVTRRYHNTSSVIQMEKSSKICNQKIPQYQQCHTNGEEQQDM